MPEEISPGPAQNTWLDQGEGQVAVVGRYTLARQPTEFAGQGPGRQADQDKSLGFARRVVVVLLLWCK